MMIGSGPEDASAQDAELPRFCTFRPKNRTKSPSSGRSTLSHVRIPLHHAPQLDKRQLYLLCATTMIAINHTPRP
jgi:hypothetical protein